MSDEVKYYCSHCKAETRPQLWPAGVGGECHEAELLVEADQCSDWSPPHWTGRWRDWHRGHNCNLDPNLVGETHHRLRPLTDSEYCDLYAALTSDDDRPAADRARRRHLDGP